MSTKPPGIWGLRFHYALDHYILMRDRPYKDFRDGHLRKVSWFGELAYRSTTKIRQARYKLAGGKCPACRTPAPHHKPDCHYLITKKA